MEDTCLVQLETYVGAIVAIVVVAILYFYFALSRKKRKEAAEEEQKLGIMAPETIIGLTEVRGIGPKWSEKLKAAGINSANDLAECLPKDLVEKVGVSEKTASKWINDANDVLSGK